MTDTRYLFQSRAHQAVARALAQGRLAKEPCEQCGGEAEAHHDNYHPDFWLVVRWLCRKHHFQWHAENEPLWPEVRKLDPPMPRRRGEASETLVLEGAGVLVREP